LPFTILYNPKDYFFNLHETDNYLWEILGSHKQEESQEEMISTNGF